MTPDPGTEDMFRVKFNKFAFTPGHLYKLVNPKSHDAFYACGGIAGLEIGLRTNLKSGLSIDEESLDGNVVWAAAAPADTPPFGKHGSAPPAENAADPLHIPPPLKANLRGAYCDRKQTFRDNQLPGKKPKSAWRAACTPQYDYLLSLLLFLPVFLLPLRYSEKSDSKDEEDEISPKWAEAMSIIVATVSVFSLCKQIILR